MSERRPGRSSSESLPRARLIACLLLAVAPACARTEPPAPPRSSDAALARPTSPAPPLRVTDLAFAGPAGLREDHSFSRGEHPTCLFSVSGFVFVERRARVHADVEVRDGNGATVLVVKELPVLDGAAPTLRPGLVRGAVSLKLPAATSPGRHTLRLVLRDLLGGGRGEAEGPFTVLGRPPVRSPKLAVAWLRPAVLPEQPAGAVVPLAFEAIGLSARRGADGQFRFELGAKVTLRNPRGGVVDRHEEKLLARSLPFEPASHPLELQLLLPRTLAPGRHAVELELVDRLGGASAAGQTAITIVPPRLGVFAIHLHDAAGLPRTTFQLGEQVYLRFSVHGFKTAADAVDLAVDLAIGGPDGGVYLAQKDAVVAPHGRGEALAREGRLPAQLPLVLPSLAPTGGYRVVLRARDRLARREATAELAFTLQGRAPAPLADFAIDALEVRDRADLPPGKGDTFVEGRRYHLTVRAGGGKLRSPRKLTYEVQLEGNLRLRGQDGRLLAERRGLFRLERTLNYRPLRLLLPAEWTVPPGTPAGLHDLEVELLDRYENRVSQLRRRVEVVSAGPAARVTLP
ncbi:MAG: hypothetical protein IT371_07620 [Deltaproteobacteria bacterium]|nr:hypothetical protein [Deltaproteobacteria bacterium]